PEEDLAKALKGKAVYIVGADPVGDDPVLAKALNGAKFVAVQDILETATTEIADVVFPAQAFSEREGSFVSGERRVQRFYPAVPVKGDAKPDFAITSMVAKQMGVILEGSSPSVVFDIMSHSIDAFNELTYAKLAEVHGQWPIVGRGDVYYGGTTYENTRGLGVQLAPVAQAGGSLKLSRVRKEAALRPKDKELLAVPANKLYDLGLTVRSADLLEGRIGEASIFVHSDTAEKLEVEAGSVVKISFDGVSGEAVLKIDDTISTGVVLVPRSMGIAIHEPVIAKVK
ncbi:MAG TPA: molybdopterin-dependent oxidoreductase, partial [Anaerolineales bacterium]|nr:molybdopterin-dependent oxidoreductase [Anaerolineales bacterium]